MNRIQIKNFPPLSYACAEAVNTLCTNLMFSGENVRKMMITSTQASEGKSFVSMNIMRTMAKLGKTVAFVDADLRRSTIVSKYHVQFEDEANRWGLVHLLAGMVNEEDVIYGTNIPGAIFVPVGRDVSNSLPLLNSPRFSSLLDDLTKIVDYVIVDAPPVGTIIDAAAIAPSCDGTLLVVNYNSVHRQELIDVKHQLEQTGCPVLGTVLNQVKFDSYLSKKYYYKSYYSNSDEFKRGNKQNKREVRTKNRTKR